MAEDRGRFSDLLVKNDIVGKISIDVTFGVPQFINFIIGAPILNSHLFVPKFKTATIGGPPLYGAQQIHGNNPDLRVGEVSFPSPFYARSEIIKASSALTVARKIVEKIQDEGVISPMTEYINSNILLESISKPAIDQLAGELAVSRGYPEPLSKLVIEQ